MLVLEGAQAGLSWSTILNKREGYRGLFAGFDIDWVARFTEKDIERIVQNARIVRNRAKIESAVTNARAVQQIQQEHGSFADFVWSFVGGAPTDKPRDANNPTPESDALSKAAQEIRMHVRRHGHLLRVHAGDGHGQQSCRRLPLTRKTRGEA